MLKLGSAGTYNGTFFLSLVLTIYSLRSYDLIRGCLSLYLPIINFRHELMT